MASTKQRQLLAKFNRKIKKLNVDTTTIHTNIYSQIDRIESCTSIRLAGPKQLGVMFGDFVADYKAKGDTFRALSSDGRIFFTEGNRTSYAITYKGEDVGFIVLHDEDDQDHCKIEVVYIKPQFRHQGFSSLAYRWAIVEKSAKVLELSFQRVKAKIPYWRALGFTKICGLPGQTGSDIALCVISNVYGADLNEMTLTKLRWALNKGINLTPVKIAA